MDQLEGAARTSQDRGGFAASRAADPDNVPGMLHHSLSLSLSFVPLSSFVVVCVCVYPRAGARGRGGGWSAAGGAGWDALVSSRACPAGQTQGLGQGGGGRAGLEMETIQESRKEEEDLIWMIYKGFCPSAAGTTLPSLFSVSVSKPPRSSELVLIRARLEHRDVRHRAREVDEPQARTMRPGHKTIAFASIPVAAPVDEEMVAEEVVVL